MTKKQQKTMVLNAIASLAKNLDCQLSSERLWAYTNALEKLSQEQIEQGFQRVMLSWDKPGFPSAAFISKCVSWQLPEDMVLRKNLAIISYEVADWVARYRPESYDLTKDYDPFFLKTLNAVGLKRMKLVNNFDQEKAIKDFWLVFYSELIKSIPIPELPEYEQYGPEERMIKPWRTKQRQKEEK